jgi:predicted secreted Zn-dependent protease
VQEVTQDSRVEIQWYDVAGETAEELREQLERFGPVDQFGRRRDAYTQWHVRWSWPFNGHEPIFEETDSEYSAVVHLPRWLDKHAASEDLQKQWDKFVSAVIQHEFQHILHIKEHHTRIEKRIQRAAQENPHLDSKTANAIARKVVNKIHKLDRLYDKRTESGKLEGVKFP